MPERPKIGVSAVIFRGAEVLLGRRLNSHGSGTWCFPGGHLEFGEDIVDCARREVAEETGLHISEIKIGPWTNDIFKEEGKHYITLFVTARYQGGTPQVREPDKSGEWQWFPWDNLPSPLFLPIGNLLAAGYRLKNEVLTQDSVLLK